MLDLNSALASSDLVILVLTAAALGILHTILGPDHYLPFVMMSRAQEWSTRKTAIVVFWCGFGHVASSLVIGVFLAWGGMAVSEWAGSQWEFWHEARGNLSAWLLMGVGIAFMIWGIVKGLRRTTHSHMHIHSDKTTHSHLHSHNQSHMHVHKKTGSVTPWILFTIFIFGPCESLIPLILSSWSLAGTEGVLYVSIAFGFTTIASIMATVGVLLLGIQQIPMEGMNRWATTLAGLSLVLCGGAIQWLGL